MFKYLRLAILPILLGAFMFMTIPAQAEDPSPSATPTSTTEYILSLPSGTSVVVERRITYGEIAMVIAIMVVSVIFIVYFMLSWVKKWLR